MNKEKIETNRANWDDRAEYHYEQGKNEPDNVEAYNINAFKNGRCNLRPYDIEALPDVNGKSLLHLQCHIGVDTLCWARRGAVCTGIDFSGKAIAIARQLAQETGLKADFVESDVYELPEKLKGKFDIVYTSRGVLCWLPDLEKWAKVAAHFLKSGGIFFVQDDHPIADCIEPLVVSDRTFMAVERNYFQKEANVYTGGTYTGGDAVLKNPTSHQWLHSFSDIITGIAKAGLIIEELKEYSKNAWRRYPQMTLGNDGHDWIMPADLAKFPLEFTIKAHK